MEFLISNIPTLTPECIQEMLPRVSAQRREAALRYTHLHGQYCCLRAYCMLMELMHITEADRMPEMLYNEHGKPYFSGGPEFSISHCKTGILVAIDDSPIGVDIETRRRVSDPLVRYTMNEDEQADIAGSTDPELRFAELWTRKEALLKQQGTGIQSTEQLRSLLGHTDAEKTETTEAYSLESFQHEQFVCSICRRR